MGLRRGLLITLDLSSYLLRPEREDRVEQCRFAVGHSRRLAFCAECEASARRTRSRADSGGFVEALFSPQRQSLRPAFGQTRQQRDAAPEASAFAIQYALLSKYAKNYASRMRNEISI